jgi:hypothetical protein
LTQSATLGSSKLELVDPTVTNLLKLLDASPLSGQSIEEIATGLQVSRIQVLVQPQEDPGYKRWQLTDKGLRQQRETAEPS